MQAVANKLNNFLRAEPVRVCACGGYHSVITLSITRSHSPHSPTRTSSTLINSVMTVQRVRLLVNAIVISFDSTCMWKRLYDLHFLREPEEVANKCQWGFNLRHQSTEVHLSL